MPFRIIRNNEENHLSEVKMLFGGSTEIVITSPFLSVDVMKSLGHYLTERVKNVTLITTLKPHAVEQFNKIGFVSPERRYEDRPLYVRRKCNQNIMGKDVGFCMVSKR